MSAIRRRRRARRGPSGRCCARRKRCRSGGLSARRRGASRSFTPSRISSSTRSISPGTSSRGSRANRCPARFFDDWVGVAAEEAVHFELLVQRLADFGARYGDLPAHDGLWELAAATADDLLARLAVVPLVLEARGLDVTPEMAATLERVGDPESAAVLRRIYRDEIDHVAAGVRWFDELCRARGLVPEETFRELVRRYFKGELKPPFNHEARAAAGFPARYYEPLLRGGVPLLRG